MDQCELLRLTHLENTSADLQHKKAAGGESFLRANEDHAIKNFSSLIKSQRCSSLCSFRLPQTVGKSKQQKDFDRESLKRKPREQEVRSQVGVPKSGVAGVADERHNQPTTTGFDPPIPTATLKHLYHGIKRPKKRARSMISRGKLVVVQPRFGRSAGVGKGGGPENHSLLLAKAPHIEQGRTYVRQ